MKIREKKILSLGLPLSRNTGVSVAQKNNSFALNTQKYTVDQINTYDKNSFEFVKNNQLIKTTNNITEILDELKNDYDVIHTHSYIWSELSQGANLTDIKKKIKAPLIYTFHSQQVRENPEQEQLAKSADLLTFLTNYEREQYLNKTPSKSTAIIPNTINFENIAINGQAAYKKRQELGLDNLIILYTGRFSPEKGCKELAEAVSTMYEKGTKIKLVLVGKDSLSSVGEEEKLRKILTPGCYEFTGWLNRDQQAFYHKISDIKIIPSFNEAFCLSGVESINDGLPIAVTDIPTLREIYINEDAAIGITTPKPKHIIDAINTYIENKPYWIRQVKNIKENFIIKYSPQTIGKKLVEEYKKLK